MVIKIEVYEEYSSGIVEKNTMSLCTDEDDLYYISNALNTCNMC